MPPRPKVADPEPSNKAPLLPLLELPVLKISIPLAPVAPALVDRRLITPLLVAVPSPPETVIAPPVLTVLRPL